MTNHENARPDPEVVGAFVEGRLGPEERAEMIRHLDQCQPCRNEVAVLADMAAAAEPTGSRRETERRRGTQSAWWLVAAASLVTIASALVFWPGRTMDPGAPIAPLVAATSPLEYRLVEARLSHSSGWAVWRTVRSSTEARNDPQRLKILGAAGDVLQNAETNPSPETQHAAAIASLLIDDPAGAIERLKKVTAERPNDARAWSDLAAAYHASAAHFRKPVDENLALAAADRALRIDPNLLEATFNRALILEKLGLTREARDTWTRYLALDASSEWSREARTRLAALTETTEQSLFRKGLPQLERNAAAGATEAVAQFVGRYPELSRRYMEAETLGLWGEAFRAGNQSEADRQLAIARPVGAALRARSGEALLADLVAVIDTSPPPARARLAEAHAAYRSGRMVLGARQSQAARKQLLDAASRFGDTPGRLIARNFAAVARNLGGDSEGAAREFQELGTLAEALPNYKALRAQIAQEHGLAEALLTHFVEAIEHYRRAHDLYTELGERSNAAYVMVLIGEREWYLGRRDEAWQTWSGAVRTLSETGIGNRLSVWLNAASRSELISGNPETARSFLDIELRQPQTSAWVRAETLFRLAILSARLQDVAGGTAAIAEGQRVAMEIEDENVRDQALADLGVAEGALFASSDPRRALEALTRAVEKRLDLRRMLLPAALFERAGVLRTLGRIDEAEQDLRSAIDAVEEQREKIEWRDTASGALDGVDEIYTTLADLLLERGKPREAFAIADRAAAHAFYGASAAGSRRSLDGLQKQLVPGTVVVEYLPLPDQFVIFAFDSRTFEVRESAITATEVSRIINALDKTLRDVAPLPEVQRASSEAERILIAPVRELLRGATSVTFVPHPLLASVPFSALFDATSKRWLVEDHSIRIAATALYTNATRPGASSRAVVIRPPGGVDLPKIAAEVATVKRLYPGATVIEGQATTVDTVLETIRDANVIHYAGHSDSERDAGLVLRVENGRTELLYGSDVARTQLRGSPLVVLAGCRTLRGGLRREDLATSLARAFLLAGARAVVGTTWDVDDDPASTFFSRFHELNSATGNAVNALCDAQRSMLHDGRRHPAEWAFAQIVVRTLDI